MQAIIITQPGDADVLKPQSVPKPQPAAGQVLIRVLAAGINRMDVLQRQGRYGGDWSGKVPGVEVAGTVEEAGVGVLRWRVGDAVCALLPDGGYAEYVVAEARHCLPIPPGLTMTEAASLPETVLTVWDNVFRIAHLQPAEHLLVHGGSSGIGITAIQLARAFGAKVFVTVGNDEKKTFCEQLGAEKAVNYQTDDFEETLQSCGIDVVLDMVGGAYTSKNLRLLNPNGRLVFINAMQGVTSEINILQVMQKRLMITGSTLKPQSDDYKAQLMADVEQHVWPLLQQGIVKPVIDSVFGFAHVADAHRRMESSRHIGKLVLTF